MRKILRKVISVACVIMLCVSLTVSPVFAEGDIKVLLDGRELSFDVPARIVNDRTMVPVRTIFEALGASVDWEESLKFITASKDGTDILLQIGNNKIYKNKTTVAIDVPPQIINERTLVPARVVAESFNCKVDWDKSSRSVIITSGNGEISVSDNNIAPEINRINLFIDNGLYLEAIKECDQMQSWDTLSSADIELVSKLRKEAQNRYAEYLAERIKWEKYRFDEWGMEFTGLKSYNSTYFTNSDYIDVYNSGDSSIKITSYKIGTIGSYGPLTSDLRDCIKHLCLGYEMEGFELVSETETTVGNLEAYQRTYCRTGGDSQIQRNIVFKHGDRIYLINAKQDEGAWDDDFYELLEKVRTTINFSGGEMPISYDNITVEVNQIRSFIAQGLYAEAMQECERTKTCHNLSGDDISLLNDLYNQANANYQDYLKQQKQIESISIKTNDANLSMQAIINAKNQLKIPSDLPVDVYIRYWYWEATGRNAIGIDFYDRRTGKNVGWCEDLDRDGTVPHKFATYPGLNN